MSGSNPSATNVLRSKPHKPGPPRHTSIRARGAALGSLIQPLHLPPPPPQWTHVVGVQNGSAQNLYINGTQAGTASASTSVSGIDIKRRGDGIYLNSGIGIVPVYSIALTLQQVKQNCNAQ